MIEFRPALGQAEHQADAVAIEERHLAGDGEQVLHAERVAIEGGGAFDIVGVDADLADCGEVEHSFLL